MGIPLSASRILVGLGLLGLLGLAGSSRPLVPPLAAQSVSPTMITHWPYRPKEFAFIFDGRLFHLFYMRHDFTAPHDDSTEVDIGHAVSADLTHWSQRDPVLHVRSDNWDNLHVWAPFIMVHDSTYYMYYAGVTNVPYPYRAYQRIGLATSTDLVSWTRYDAPVYEGNMVPWALADSSRFEGCQFRDPFVMEDPAAPDHWLLYFSATPRDAADQLIVGVASNQTGLAPWQDLTPLWNTDAAHFLGYVESPCVFPHGGRWYLFFTTNSGHPIRFQHTDSPTADSTGWVGTFRLYDNAPDTDQWFAPEYLKVGDHEYFAAVNSMNHGIEIREMVWTGIATFSLVTPTVVGVSDGPRREAGPSIEAVGGVEGGDLKFRVVLPQAMIAKIGVYDVAGRRIRILCGSVLPGGETVVGWDRKGAGGRDVASGMYVVKLDTPLGARSAKARVLR